MNTFYVVCEFPNEEEKVSIGYAEWLTTTDNDDKKELVEARLKELIDSEQQVKMKWPKDCVIRPRSANMKTLENCKWESVIAILRAYGEWKNMSEVIRNFEKYGTGQVAKKDRQKFTKKVFSSSDDEIYDARPAIKKNKEKKKAETNAIMWRFETWEKFKEAKNTILRNNKENKVTAEFLSNENVDKIRESAQNTSLDCMFMRELNNGYAKVLTSLQEGFATITQDLKRLKSDIKEIKKVVQVQKLHKGNNKMDDIQKCSKLIGTDVIMQVERGGGSIVAKDNSEVERKTDISIKEIDTKQISSVDIEELHVAEDDGARESQKREVFESDNNNCISSADHQKISDPHNEDTDLGGPWPCKVSTRLLQKCNHDTMEKLVCDLLGVLFSKEELATSSLTGAKSNFTNKAAKKQILDPSKVAAIRAYVFDKFPPGNSDEKKFRDAVKRKCNNACPRNSRLQKNQKTQ